MTSKKINTKMLASLCGIALLYAASYGCQRHEVIPPPIKLVEFDAELSATISDTIDILYRDGENSIVSETNSPKTIDANQLNTARYRVRFYNSEPTNNEDFTLNRGYLKWSGTSQVPELSQFQEFFVANENISYARVVALEEDGVQVRWVEENGTVWETMRDTTGTSFGMQFPHSFQYTSVTQESDTLDYVIFTAAFECRMWRFTDTDTLYRDLKNGVLKYRYIRE